MRIMNLDELDTYNSGANKGKINWTTCEGRRCKFIYDGIDGVLTITKKDNKYVYFIYDGVEYKKATGHFKNCEIADVVGKISMDHRYSVGDIINECEILKQTRKIRKSGRSIRSYDVRCVKCGYITNDKLESTLDKGGSCSVCASRLIVRGKNDIATTHKHLIKYFVNIDDAQNNSYASNNKLLMKCPDCGYEQMCTPNYLSNKGFPCKKCGDGVSYPEKIMFNMLSQVGVDFIAEYSPDWIGRSRYDFYIPEYKIIIEMDGELHYSDNNMSNQTKEESVAIDIMKENMAMKNGIFVIRIDSRKSNINYIKENIISSPIFNVLNVDTYCVDWLKCHEFACSSRVKEACDLWNNGVRSTTKIGNIMKLYNSTICNYLKKGSACGMCDYDPKKATSDAAREVCKNRTYVKKEKKFVVPKSIIDKATKENLIRDICNDFNNGESRNNLSVKYKLSIDVICKHLRDGLNNGLCSYDYNEDNYRKLQRIWEKNKKAICVYFDNNLIGEYESAQDLQEKSITDFGKKFDFRNISAVCNGKRKTYKGYIFKFKNN